MKDTRGIFDNPKQAQWKEVMNRVKQLYLNRKYKHCAALCNETLIEKVVKSLLELWFALLIIKAHPLHETALQFFAAVCYESLGNAAHNHSIQKLSFLNLAKDKFAAALATLPLPPSSNNKGRFESPGASLLVTVFPPPPQSTLKTASPIPQFSGSAAPTFDTTSTSSDDEDVHDSVPDFDQYTGRQFILSVDSADSDNPVTIFRPTRDHKTRLSQSLSTHHVIEETLIPTPLFDSQKKIPVGDLPPASRPLPPIPSRDPVLRKTALQTILNLSAITHFDTSPITPRFSQIKNAFTPKPHHKHLHAYLTSHPLSPYNDHISSFRTQLLAHIATVSAAIDTITALQQEHKRNKTTRLASYWSIKPEDVEGREKKERIARLRREGWMVTKERHGWKGIEHYEALRARALGELEEVSLPSMNE